MSWNRDRWNREDDERDFTARSQDRWNRDFDYEGGNWGQQNRSNRGRDFEGDYGYGRDYDYERSGRMGGGGWNQGRYMGSGYDRDFESGRGGFSQGRRMGGGWDRDYDYGRGGPYQARRMGGGMSQGRQFGGWDRDYEPGRGQFGGGYDRDYEYGGGGRMRGGDYDYSGGYGEGDWSAGSSTYGAGRGMGGYDRDFESGRGYGGQFQGRPFGGGFNRDFEYGQGQGGYGSSFGRGQFGGMNRGPYYGRGPRGWQRSDDRIREDVNEALTNEPWLDATDINVTVNSGEVTLGGTVESRYAKRMAEDTVERISGVRDVHNNLRVQQGDEGTQARGEGATSRSGSTTGQTRANRQAAEKTTT